MSKHSISIWTRTDLDVDISKGTPDDVLKDVLSRIHPASAGCFYYGTTEDGRDLCYTTSEPTVILVDPSPTTVKVPKGAHTNGDR